jgi:hypothetical protein
VNEALAIDYSNQALTDIGETGISSFNSGVDDSTQAAVANQRYEQILRKLLISHRWEWATVQQELAQLSADAEQPIAEWEFAYALPTDPDYLRVVRLARTADSLQTNVTLLWPRVAGINHMIRSNQAGDKVHLYSNWSEMFLEYIGRVDEVNFSEAFVDALITALAHAFAKILTDNDEMVKEKWLELHGDQARRIPGKLSTAKTIDSKNSPNVGWIDDAGLLTGR